MQNKVKIPPSFFEKNFPIVVSGRAAENYAKTIALDNLESVAFINSIRNPADRLEEKIIRKPDR